MLEMNHTTKTFHSAGKPLTVLHDITLSISKGSSCAVTGPSGSGKTTLLGLAAGLDRPTSGTIRLGNTYLGSLNEDALAKLRRETVGFVFQSFRLIPSLTALENVMVPAELRGIEGARDRARKLLDTVGLSSREMHYPVQLSGGEQQRVALARAFVNHPSIIFADEPTGNLDADTGARVLDLLFSLNEKEQTTLVLVTHDPALTRRVDRIVRLENGRLHDHGG